MGDVVETLWLEEREIEGVHGTSQWIEENWVPEGEKEVQKQEIDIDSWRYSADRREVGA